MKKSGFSLGGLDYSFKVTIYLKDGNEADDFNNFIINSNSLIRKGPFLYTICDGNTWYEIT